MSKLDFVKTEKDYYSAKAQPALVELGAYQYITSQGNSAPEDPAFTQAIGSLYGLAYPLKFAYKGMDKDFTMPKMEAYWWMEKDIPFEEAVRTDWHWKLMIPMPDFVEESEFQKVLESAREKGKVHKETTINFEAIHEDKVVQVLHLGSYEEEKESIGKVMDFIEEQGLEVNGHHREIYLSDPMKTATEKLRTILRYAVK